MPRRPPCWDVTGGDAALPLGKSSPDCLAWPEYTVPRSSTSSAYGVLSGGIKKAIGAISQSHGKISHDKLRSLARQRCVARQCLHIQILERKVFVIAPHSERCSPGDYVGGPCSTFIRQRTDGVAASGAGTVGKWDRAFSPTTLRWDFAAGVNLSSCQASVTAGDFNGPFTRLRMLTSLRLLNEAARAGTLVDTELLLCLQETPLNVGGWCLRGPQPVFSMTTNEEAPLLAFPHWLARLRDVDFALWENARQATRASAASTRSDARARKAVFRGGVYRLSVYTDRWRSVGAQKTMLTKSNWMQVGRTSLLRALLSRDARHLVDANVFLQPFAERLGINTTTLSMMSSPTSISLAEQQARFRYVLNVATRSLRAHSKSPDTRTYT